MTAVSCSRDNVIPTNFIFYGDSHIERWNLYYYFPGSDYVNEGEGGATISDVQLNINKRKKKELSCILEVGTNDIRKYLTQRLEADSIKNKVIYDYKILIDSSLQKFNDVKVIGIIPLPQYNNSGTANLYYDINDQLKALVNTYKNASFISIYPFLTDKSNYLQPSLTQDGLHLNTYGYEKLSDEVTNFLY